MSELENLKYPIGRFTPVSIESDEQRASLVRTIAECPRELRAAVDSFSDAQYDTPYREGGWTVRQLVHHIFDSHCNAYIRFRLTITQDNPLVNAYDEAVWAELEDSFSVPPSVSLDLTEGVHRRWVATLENMSAEDFARPLQHPENGPMTCDGLLQMYAWHSLHHVRHITALSERMGW